MDGEQVVLVDEDDEERGVAEKRAAHVAPGLLHRALSVVLWAPGDRLVLQRRALAKETFAGLWSNSACSHPRPGEAVADAARRRVVEELGAVPSGLTAVGRCTYALRDEASGLVERELDHVLVGAVDGDLSPDPAEVAEVVCLGVDAVAGWLAREPHAFTPWFPLVMGQAVPGPAWS